MPPQILADHATLFQTGWAIGPPQCYLPPPPLGFTDLPTALQPPDYAWWSWSLGWSRKFLDKQEWWIAFSWFVIKLLLRYKYVVQCAVHVFQTLKNGFSNRADGIMISPLFSFRLFFVSGGTITNDLSTARNRSIIWRHCLCIGNGSGNIARNTNTGIGLMYIYVIFLTIRKKRRLWEKKTTFLNIIMCWMLFRGLCSDWKFITEISFK